MTVPFDNVPLGEQRDRFVELEDAGYSDLWSAEAMGTGAFTPLALASVWTPSMRLGTAIVPAFTRGPPCWHSRSPRWPKLRRDASPWGSEPARM